MHCFYVPDLDESEIRLDKNESRHLAKVLRLSLSDTVWVSDGRGKRYTAVVSKADPRESWLEVGEAVYTEQTDPFLEVAIAPPKKPQRFEWFVEKATELGVHRIAPLICHRSEKHRWKMDRLHKIAVSAMKQSLRAWLPEIPGPVSMDDFLREMDIDGTAAFIARQSPEHPMLSDSPKAGSRRLLLIGPEGDFTDEEYEAAIKAGLTGVNLSAHRLRTETAALAGLVQLIVEN